MHTRINVSDHGKTLRSRGPEWYHGKTLTIERKLPAREKANETVCQFHRNRNFFVPTPNCDGEAIIRPHPLEDYTIKHCRGSL